MAHETVMTWALILIPCSALVIALIVGCTFPTYMLAAGLISRSNLWPVGVVIGCVMTMPPAFLGAGVGAMIGQRRKARRLAPPDMPALPG